MNFRQLRFFQDKERQFREQLAELQQKLKTSQQGEAALKQQLQFTEEQCKQLRSTVQSLTEDKNSNNAKVIIYFPNA